ncbi:MAG: hypothetical protein ACI8SE_000591 [Bacteroidia bacterium]
MDNNKNISEFDSLFKQSFEGASSPVPPGVWEGVSSVTTGVAGASSASLLSKLFGLKGAAILGSVAVIVTTTMLLINTVKETPEAIDSTEIVESIQTDKNIQNSNTDPSAENTILISDEDKTTAQSKEMESGQRDENNQDNSTSHESTNPVNKPITVQDSGAAAKSNNDGVKEVNVSLSASLETVCVHQKVDVSLKAPITLSNVKWSLNGNPVASPLWYMSFMFDAPGSQEIRVSGQTQDGRQVEAFKTIQVTSASAVFKVSQQDGEIQLSSLKPIQSNQWYADQVLIKENQVNTTYRTENDKTTITHIATGLNGCIDTSRQVVVKSIDCLGDLKISNIFTPYHQDGFNDVFVIDLPQVENYRLTIYNLRDAKVVFDTDDQHDYWNGKYDNGGTLVPAGYYLYRIVYTCNGKTTTKQDRIMVSDAKD